MRRLPFVPLPYLDEALSSWLARIAAAEGLYLRDLLDEFDLPVHCDAGLSPGQLAELAAALGHDLATVAQMTCRRPGIAAAIDDLAPADLETGLRGGLCPLCLAGDEEAGRDHYLRRPWVSAWTVACEIHGLTLVDIASADAQMGGVGRRGRRVRFSREVDDVVAAFRFAPTAARWRHVPCPAQAMMFQSEVERLRNRTEALDWLCLAGSWEDNRQTLLDLGDLLASVSRVSERPLHAMFITGDRPVGQWASAMSAPGCLLRMDPRHRAYVFDALVSVLVEPKCFSVLPIHEFGPSGFFRLFRTFPRAASGPLGRLATLDPFAVILSHASQEALAAIEQRQINWPASLKARLGHAAAVAAAAG